jgi:hypothetical protein
VRLYKTSIFLKTKHYLLLVCCVIVLFVAGCRVSYSLNGASIPPEAKTVSVTLFQSNTPLAPPRLSQVFTEALRTQLSSQSRLGLVARDGDLAFEGSIIGYSTAPIAVQSTAVAAKSRLTITVSVKYTCSFDEKKNFESTFSQFEDYDSNENLSSVENGLIELINTKLTQEIFNKALNNW